MICTGNVVLKATVNGVTVTLNALVSGDLKDEMLVSWHDLINMKDFPHGRCRQTSELLSTSSNDSIEGLIRDFPNVLSDTLGSIPMKRPEMHIYLRDDVPIVPMRVMTTSQVPVHQAEAANALVDRLVPDGILAPVHEPTEWISPG